MTPRRTGLARPASKVGTELIAYRSLCGLDDGRLSPHHPRLTERATTQTGGLKSWAVGPQFERFRKLTLTA